MAASAVNSLPESGGMILSDDPYRLYTVYDALNRKGVLDRFILIDSTAMHNPLYHRCSAPVTVNDGLSIQQGCQRKSSLIPA